MNLLGCVAALVAMALAYLTARNQRLLARPLGRKARMAAWVFAVIAFAAWIAGETSLANQLGLTNVALTKYIHCPRERVHHTRVQLVSKRRTHVIRLYCIDLINHLRSRAIGSPSQT